MTKKSINPAKLFNSIPYGFSQIISAERGRMVFISGQVAWDEHMNIVGPNDLAVQTQKSIDNLKIAMEAAGGSLADIVMLRIYKVAYQAEDGPIITEVLKRNFGPLNPPASTWLSVVGLANEGFLIEIEAQAIINNIK